MKKYIKRFVAKENCSFSNTSNNIVRVEKSSVWNFKTSFEDEDLNQFLILQETADIKNEIIVPNDLFFNFCFQEV